MDVVFHPTGGKPFCIEIGYFDTVLEIKEKIQIHQNIPVSKQTLIFNGNILGDELNVFDSNILDRCRIQVLLTSSDPPPETNNHNHNHVKKEVLQAPSPKKKIQLLVKIPILKSGGAGNINIIAVEMDPDDTIRKLKDKIRGIEGVNNKNHPLLSVHANGVELQDHRTIRDCELSDSSEIDVNFRIRSSTVVSSGSSSVNSGGSGTVKVLKVQVLVNGVGSGKRKIPIEVNHTDNVGELKKQLQRLNELLHLNLPQEGFFFIYKQNVMDDDRSFRWHHVGQGDTIEIFSGSISGGL